MRRALLTAGAGGLSLKIGANPVVGDGNSPALKVVACLAATGGAAVSEVRVYVDSTATGAITAFVGYVSGYFGLTFTPIIEVTAVTVPVTPSGAGIVTLTFPSSITLPTDPALGIHCASNCSPVRNTSGGDGSLSSNDWTSSTAPTVGATVNTTAYETPTLSLGGWG